ncbi:MAG: histidine kinase, partial [Demequina sp.]
MQEYAKGVERTIPRLGDVAIAASLLIMQLAGIVMLESYEFEIGRRLDALGLVIVLGMSVPIAWRHRFPRTVLWATFLSWMAYVGLEYSDSTGIFGPIVAMYGIGLYLRRREAALHGGIVIAIAVLWTGVGVMLSDDLHVLAIVSVIIALGLPLLIGRVDNRRHARLTELEVAHTRREQAKEAAAHDAVRSERARIARELHDVVAHEMTVMTLQAEGAKRRATSDTDPAVTAALDTISESGRRGLTEMQRMIGVLRASEQAAANAAEHEHGAATGSSVTSYDFADVDELSPMPSLTGLTALASKVEDSGLPVHLEISGDAHVPAGVELSAYRIVQESLTNAMKHAGPGATAYVHVKRERDRVTITVEDDGRGVISDAANTHGGHGIAGMRERVLALGGTL